MKLRLLSILLAACMTIPLFSGAVLAAETGSSSEETVLPLFAEVDGMKICTVFVENDFYLFLPASANLSKLKLISEQQAGLVLKGTNGQRIRPGMVNIKAVSEKDAFGRYLLRVSLPDGEKTLYIMQGTGLPTIYLTSDDNLQNRNWVDLSKKNEATGHMKLVQPDGAATYDGSLTQIKPRGNSTFTYSPKKSYQIKLSDKTDLLGNGEKNKTWVLLAYYGDATLMHDKLFKDLASALGMPYVVSCDWVNLYYDGEYRGVYLLGEKNSLGGTGVDITDMEDAYSALNENYGDDMVTAEATNAYGQKYLYTTGLTEPENLTGGWLIELNTTKVDEASGFFTRKNMGFNVKSPEFAGQQAMTYISEYYQAFEDAVYAVDASGNYTGFNPETGKYYDEYVDLTSLVQTFLLQELALNPDGFRSSLYFHKDVDGILYAGPIWDQDMTLGTGWEIYISPEVKDYHYLAEALIQIPSFCKALEEYFRDTFLPQIEALLGETGTIAGYKAILSDNAAMNYMLWPYVRIGAPFVEGHLWAGDPDYDVVTADMVDWVTRRIEVLKTRFLPSEHPASDRFPDIRGHEAESAINFVVERGLFTGTGDKFEPNTVMNRAMLVTVLHRLAGMPEGGTQNFPDVPADEWYTEAVAWASGNGIVEGDASGFHPLDRLTREQLVTILYRYAKTLGLDTSVRGDLSQFYDTGRISPWAEEAVSWAVGTGVLKGRDATSLAPLSSARRGVVAMSFEQIILLIEK